MFTNNPSFRKLVFLSPSPSPKEPSWFCFLGPPLSHFWFSWNAEGLHEYHYYNYLGAFLASFKNPYLERLVHILRQPTTWTQVCYMCITRHHSSLPFPVIIFSPDLEFSVLTHLLFNENPFSSSFPRWVLGITHTLNSCIPHPSFFLTDRLV